MWNKRSLFLLVRVRLRGVGTRLRLLLPLALYVPHQWLLAWDGLRSLLPAKICRAVDAVHAILLQLLYAEPQTIADVDIRDGKQQVYVLVRTWGFGEVREEPPYTRAQTSAQDENTARESGWRHLPPATRLLGCLTALSLSALIFPGAANLSGVLLGSLLLTLLYVLIRPLLLTLALPANLLLLGLVTPFADALLIRWTAAWVGGLSLTYWQCVAVALVISAAYLPYSLWKQRALQT